MSARLNHHTVITRLVRVIQLDRPHEAGDDGFCFGIQ